MKQLQADGNTPLQSYCLKTQSAPLSFHLFLCSRTFDAHASGALMKQVDGASLDSHQPFAWVSSSSSSFISTSVTLGHAFSVIDSGIVQAVGASVRF